MQTSQSITTFNICNSAYQTFQALKKTSTKILCFLILLPNILAELFLRPKGDSTVKSLIRIGEEYSANTFSFQAFGETSAGFFLTYFLVNFIVILLSFIAYLALTHAVIEYKTKNKTLSAKSACKLAYRSLFFKGLALFFAIYLISLERFFWGPFPTLTMLTYVSPVILLCEKRGAINSFFKALFIKYPHPSNASGLSIFLTLFLFGALLFLSETLMNSLANSFMLLDEVLGISRSFWIYSIPVIKVSPAYLIKMLITSVGFALIFLTVPFFTSHLYFAARPKLTQKV